MLDIEVFSRRNWISSTAKTIGGLMVVGGGEVMFPQDRHASTKRNEKENETEEVSPAEDLMREHGVLKRVLLIYREVIHRIDAKRDFPPDVGSVIRKVDSCLCRGLPRKTRRRLSVSEIS